MKKFKLYKENYDKLPDRFVDKINADIDYILKADIPGLKSIYLFGSCARGDLRSTSDIDLLILTEKKLDNRMLASDIRWTLDEEINGVRTDIVYMNVDSFQEKTVFKDDVNRDKKIIVEVIK